MKFASLGSGSNGNGTLVGCQGNYLLIDCGFTIKETERRLARLQVAAENLAAILVTHEHGDHIKGVAPFARKYQLPVYMTPGTFHSRDLGKLPTLHLIHGHEPFELAGFRVTPVAVPHDAREPAQFILEAENKKLGVLTDLGSITPHIEKHYSDCDALILEANHDPLMLAGGPYPPSLKRRVGGPWGHLSNQQAANFLRRTDTEKIQHLVVAHLSQQNNSPEKAEQSFTGILPGAANMLYAGQEDGFDWLTIQ